MAALGKGTIRLRGLLHSDDTKVMISALRQLGVPRVQFEKHGEVLVIEGAAGQLKAAGDSQLYLANAGTASRFLTSAVVLASGGYSIVTGNKRMQERPIGPLVEALRANGCSIEYLKDDKCPPLKLQGGGLPGGNIELAAELSSQYVSSILMAAPFAKEPVTLKLVGTVVSQPYIDMTLALMEKFGVAVTRLGDNTYAIPNTGYVNPEVFEVEADASSASYPLAMAAISGGNVTVESVGANSLQGDAAFCHVLTQMGCHVEQDESRTTVVAPSDGILRAVDVDMGDITDTFMTAAVLMATCPKGSVSRITNIANQRVKECNRIAAMVAELGKCGVVCRELPDGLEIDGAGRETPPALQQDLVDIHCYKDHRIAMSFGVLGCLWRGLHITDKDCTDKTYPEFWDDLGRLHNNPDTVRAVLSHNKPRRETISSKENISLVIIGMRGAGKTTLGAAAARHLHYTFVDLDEVVAARCGPGGIKTLVETEGWPAFRALETAVLREALEAHTYNAVLSCGGGVVETAANLTLLEHCGLPVVWLDRDIADIEAYLGADASRPAYGESIRDVWQRRIPRYNHCATHRFALPAGHCNVTRSAASFAAVAGVITGASVPPLREDTFFLSLTLPDLAPAYADGRLHVMARDVHALELRVDLLQACDEAFLARQMSYLRAATSCPVIFTVRSRTQGGAFDGDADAYFALLRLGVRLGCDFLDVEATWSEARRQELRQEARGVRVISSLHYRDPCSSPEALLTAARRCYADGLADIVKTIYTARTVADCFVLDAGRARLADNGVDVPVILMCMGEAGKLSRALNTFFTPVTHALLPTAAAPGQLTVEEIVSVRTQLGLWRNPWRFVLFGQPIALSPSPLMHNTGFACLGLPWEFARVETDTLADVHRTLADPSMGGASVTIPFKEAIVPALHWIAPEAREIGAVNTVVRDASGRLLGYNTDWLGVAETLAPLLQGRQRALVLGGGGTARAACYALRHLGFEEIFVYNRTLAKAEALARDFGAKAVAALDGGAPAVVDAVVGTIPAAAAVIVPKHVLSDRTVVLDAAYLPAETPLLAQAKAAGCRVAHGIDMLIAQGIAQQQLFTGRTPAAAAIRKVVSAEYEQMVARKPMSIRSRPEPHEVKIATKAQVTAV